MKEGKSLQELAIEIERRSEAKKDYIASSDSLHISTQGDGAQVMAVGGMDAGLLTDYSRNQVSDHLGIPRKYVDKLRNEVPTLLDTNMNTLLGRRADEKRLVRLLDGNCRAFLSDRYRRMDNHEILDSILPVMQRKEDLVFRSCEVTDRRLYLKVVTDSVKGEVKKDDPVRAGFILSNSEVGAGSMFLKPFVERLVCTNGMVLEQSGMKKFHLGSKMEGDAPVEFLTDETKAKMDEALFLQLRDTLDACLTHSTFQAILEKFRAAAGSDPIKDPTKAVEKVQRIMNFNEGETSGILKHLCEGGDFSRWGMANAVTRMAEDVESYDRATELETIGGQIIELSPTNGGL